MFAPLYPLRSLEDHAIDLLHSQHAEQWPAARVHPLNGFTDESLLLVGKVQGCESVRRCAAQGSRLLSGVCLASASV